jgi:hypothetical protein
MDSRNNIMVSELEFFEELSELKNKISLTQSMLNDENLPNRLKVIAHLKDCFRDSLKFQPRAYDLDVEHNYVSGKRLV